MPIQYITSNKGRKVAVILPIKEYEKILEELEELEEIVAYDKAKARKTEFVEAKEVFSSIEKRSKRK